MAVPQAAAIAAAGAIIVPALAGGAKMMGKASQKKIFGLSPGDIITFFFIIIAFVFGKKILKFIKDPFGKGLTTDEKRSEEYVKAIPVNTGLLTITELQAEHRANAIYNALKGFTEDEKTVISNLTKNYWKPDNMWWSDSWDVQYAALAESEKLSLDDFRLIIKKFGVKQFGAVNVENFTLPQAIAYYDDGDLNRLFNKMMGDAGI